MFGRPKATTSGPDYWQAYSAAATAKLPRRTPIGQLRFVVLDTETDGFEHNQLVSIGYVPVQHHTILASQSREYVLQSTQPLATEGIAVHGIMPGHNQQGLPPAQALRYCLSDFGQCIMVGHRIAYDVQVLNNALKGTGKLLNPTLDTYDLAQRAAGGAVGQATPTGQQFGLDALCQQYHIPPHDRHTAAGDALITAQLLLKLLGRLHQRGITTYGQLMRTPSTLWG